MATLNDLVLVHVDNRPGFFARIDDITPDVKPGWWQVRLLVLTIPLQVYTWILDESQIAGAPFTMGGTPMMLEMVVSPPVREPLRPHPVAGDENPVEPAGHSSSTPSGKVVFLSDRKKKGDA
jgi:hypothetical protein